MLLTLSLKPPTARRDLRTALAPYTGASIERGRLRPTGLTSMPRLRKSHASRGSHVLAGSLHRG